jgi:tRNA (cmo5U34)-methyltransferase
MTVNLWPEVEHALAYLAKADSIPHRTEGEAELLSLLPDPTHRVLDLGCGDGRLLALVRAAHPTARGVALDFSPPMLAAARRRFESDAMVTVIEHDLDEPLPDLGVFDAVVSSFAIHHLEDERKRSLAAEVRRLLRPGGVFLNLEHVASPTGALHLEFLRLIGVDPANDDPSNKLVAVDTQLTWLRDLDFIDVDCIWKWRELALLVATAPGEHFMRHH